MISMQLSMTVVESQVEDYAAVYGARLAPALVKCLRTLLWLDPSDCLPINEQRPVSNKVVTENEVGLMLVVMQTFCTLVSSQLQVMCNRE